MILDVAALLGMTISQVEAMPSLEISEWAAYFEVLNEEAEARKNQ